jgi:hypothetical protein
MPRIVPLAEALKMDPGEQLPAIRGKVVKVGKYFSGESAKGPWSFQTLVIDEGGTKADVKFKGRDQIAPDAVGKVAFVVANNGERGLTGLRVEDDEYNGKTTRIVLVTPSAELTFGKGDWGTGPKEKASADSEPPKERARTEDAGDDYPSGDQPPRDESKKPAAAAGGWEAVKVDLNRIRKLHLLCCAAAAHNVAAMHKAGINVGDEFLQSAAATIFIEACKRGGMSAMPHAGEPPVQFPKFDF